MALEEENHQERRRAASLTLNGFDDDPGSMEESSPTLTIDQLLECESNAAAVDSPGADELSDRAAEVAGGSERTAAGIERVGESGADTLQPSGASEDAPTQPSLQQPAASCTGASEPFRKLPTQLASIEVAADAEASIEAEAEASIAAAAGPAAPDAAVAGGAGGTDRDRAPMPETDSALYRVAALTNAAELRAWASAATDAELLSLMLAIRQLRASTLEAAANVCEAPRIRRFSEGCSWRLLAGFLCVEGSQTCVRNVVGASAVARASPR